jgi:hypothetical protein
MTMDKVEFKTLESIDGSSVEYAIIDRGNGEFTSMLKSYYDAQLAAQDTLPSELSIPSTPQAGA